MLLNHYILVLLIISILCAQGATLIANEGEKKDIIYLKDCTFLKCEKLIRGFILLIHHFTLLAHIFLVMNKMLNMKKIEKIIYADGSIKFYGEIISSRNKIKFWYYTALTSIIVGLTLLAS